MSAVRSENKESGSSPVDGVLQALLEVSRGQDGAPRSRPGGREVKRSLPGGRRQRERRERTSGKDVPFVQAKRGVVNIASGYTL